MVKFEEEARRACEDIFGSPVVRTRSTGRSQQVTRFVLEDGRSMIATRRMTRSRANLEFHVLQKLRGEGARVPAVLAFNGQLLFQEDFGQRRLSLVLKKVNRVQGETLLAAALQSLADMHARAKTIRLERSVAMLGADDEWLRDLVDRPRVLGEFLQLPAPDLPVDRIVSLLRVTETSFIKWDARPPNAVVLNDGSVGWIDWENCGRRHRLDDLAWYFGDQSIPEWPDVEQRLLDRFVPAFIDSRGVDEAHEYLAVFGTLHMCVRLSQALNREKKRGVKSWDNAPSADRATQSALSGARKLSTRASRWSRKSPLLQSLSPWLEQVAEQLGVAPAAV